MTQTATLPAAIVPRLWPDSTIVCLATGPSLTQADVDFCRGRARVIAIKDAVRLAPWADVLYGCGVDTSKWWKREGDSLTDYAGLRFTLDPQARKWATVLSQGPPTGLSSDRGKLALGKNSGYQAINLAVHLGATTIVLLGYDMQPDPVKGNHFFGEHPTKNVPPFQHMREVFPSIVAPLQALGITVINASRVSALDIFPRQTLEEVFA